MIVLRPLSLREANAIVTRWHSHHKPVRGHKFAIGAYVDDEIVGAVIVARPVAPALNRDGVTFEVTRLCVNGYPNAGSKLLGAAWRASKAMGVVRLVSYTREDETGHVYRAAGWRQAATVKAGKWDHNAQRYLPGVYVPTTEIVDRVRWEISEARHGR